FAAESGKNVHVTWGRTKKEETKHASVNPMVSQRMRIAPRTIDRNMRRMKFGSSGVGVVGFLRSQTLIKGANRTATNQETISAMDTTAKIENVYSPAALFAKPIGTKPAA